MLGCRHIAMNLRSTLFCKSIRPTAARKGLALALAVTTAGLAGCGRPGYAGSTPVANAAERTAAPVVPSSPLPPSPVPATFDVATLAEQVKPVVVNITTTVATEALEGEMDPFEFFFGPRGRRERAPRERTGLGTGFIIDTAGHIVTNAHVVEGATEVQVRLADDREFKADVVGRDPKLDLALLRLEGQNSLPAATLGSSEALRVGEHVLAVGNPFGLGHTVTLGIVSAKARTIGAGPYDDFIQTDASINPGNSGGPLFNWRGEVIGINTAIRAGASGIGFAIPIDALKDVLPQLREHGYVERGRLGIAFQPVTPDLARALGLLAPGGALVSDVEQGGPAGQAGMRPGDVVVEVQGVSISHASDLPRHVARHRPGTAIQIGYIRDKQRREAKVTLDKLEDQTAVRPASRTRRGQATPATDARAGFAVTDAPNGGVLVTNIPNGSPVKELMEGDIIVEVGGVPVKTTVDLRAAMSKLKPGTVGLFKVKRGPVSRFVAVPVPERPASK